MGTKQGVTVDAVADRVEGQVDLAKVRREPTTVVLAERPTSQADSRASSSCQEHRDDL